MSSCRAKLLNAAAAVVLLAAPATGLAAERQATDPSVRPGDDFYRYANGPWLATAQPPQGADNYDTSAMLRALNTRRVRDLIEAQARAPSPGAGADARKIGDFYTARMDAGRIEARGMAPLARDLAAIATIGDRKALARYLGGTLRLDDGSNSQTEGVFGLWVHQGFHDPRRRVAHLLQGGLGLPAREDYLAAGPVEAVRRDLYQAHVAAVLALAGLDQPKARGVRVLALETAIARTHAPAADAVDVFNIDHAWRRADFDAKAPGLDWAEYFQAAGLLPSTGFNVWQPAAVIGTSALVASEPLEAWRDYLAYHLIEHHAAVLPRAIGDEDLAFAGRLAGAPVGAADREQQAVTAVNAALGDAVGRLYVARYFPPDAKAAAIAMVENIRAAFRPRIANSPWMSPSTRQKALAKLAAVKIGLGYPDAWVDYAGLAVTRGDAFGNQRRAEAFAYRSELAKLSRPVDPAEWFEVTLLPQAVGAVINFTPNSLQFAAGLLQPPYFDPKGDAAENYGSAGAGLAHEVSHSFDELGAIYGAEGNLERWWAPDDLPRYRAASAPLAAQLSAACPKPGLCLNGGQVLGESTADLAGLLVAHDAYLLSLHGRPDAIKDGLTGDQRFFLAFARRWRRLQSDAALRRQIATDTHAPAEYRADTVRHLEAWQRAFDVRPGDKLWLKPEERVRIW